MDVHVHVHVHVDVDLPDGGKWGADRVAPNAQGMRGASNEARDPLSGRSWLDNFGCAAMSDGFDLRNATAVAAARGEVRPYFGLDLT